MKQKPSIREASLDDAALASDVMTAAFPGEPEDPILTAERWRTHRKDYTFGRYVAELDGKPIAYLEWAHGPWDQLPERHCFVDVYVDQAHHDEELLAYLFEWIQAEAARQGARTLNSSASEQDVKMLEVMERLGFERERDDRVWVLDLVQHGERLKAGAAAARERMSGEGITLIALSEWHDAKRFEKLHGLSERTRQDIPHSTPILPQPIEYFMNRAGGPDRREDRWWIALDGDMPVAMSYLSFPPVRGNVWTGYTCCDRDYRGRGIARAVKLQTLAQAVELGVPSVRTDNDSENAPMLHINETLGYESLPGYVNFVKRLPEGALR